MKNFIAILLLGVFAFQAFAATTRTTTTSTFEESASEPVLNSDKMEAEEYDNSLSTKEVEDARWDEQQRMQEMNQEKEEAAINYSDRTRTDRARKAINTGSDASDDK